MHLVVVTPVVLRILNLVFRSQQFHVDEIACDSVPERNNVVFINSGEQVVLLLPYEIAVLTTKTLKLDLACETLNLLNCP